MRLRGDCRPYLREQLRKTLFVPRRAAEQGSLFPRPAVRATLRGVSVITLTTDFGTGDWFVGTMKGVIAGIAPQCTVVDLTHDLPPGDIRGGAFALAASYGFFPRSA